MRTRAVIVISALALSASASTSTYILQAGDTLTRVANRLGVDVATLASANDISNPRTIRAGAKLAIPLRLHSHTVKRGDTLAEIARWYGTSVTDVKARNGLKKSTIRLGQKLTVMTRRGEGQPAAPSSAGGPTHSHTVKRGDTLAEIARWYGTSVSEVRSRNGLKTKSKIRIGQRLEVPVRSSSRAAKTVKIETKPISHTAGHVHTVKKGDTLAEIAHHYGTTTATVKELNGLKSSRLKQGQKLSVPLPPAPKASEFRGLCPVKGARKYDFSDSWGSPRHGGRQHRGNDIFAKRGTPVLANVGGTLRYAHGGVAGNAYYLQGDDGHVYYGAHLDKITVRPGRVDTGQVIGTVGTSGNAMGTPPHLHFEIKPRGGASVNPNAILKKWCS